MIFRPRLTQNSIKFDRNRWGDILGAITHKNNPLEFKEERQQICPLKKTPQKHVFCDISRKRANLI
jgi:hypothetical protein